MDRFGGALGKLTDGLFLSPPHPARGPLSGRPETHEVDQPSVDQIAAPVCPLGTNHPITTEASPARSPKAAAWDPSRSQKGSVLWVTESGL